MAITNDVLIKLSAIDENVEKIMQKVGNSSTDTSKKVGGLGGAIAGMGAGLVVANQALQLAERAFGALAAPIKAAINAYTDFEKAVLEVNTLVVDNAKAADIVAEATINLSKQFGTKSIDQVKAYYQAVSGGATVGKQATELLTQANMLAIGGVSDLATATTGLVAVQNAYRVGVEDLDSINNAFFVAVKQGITTVSQLASVIGQLAPTASAANVSMQEMFSAVSAITSVGVSTSEAVTQVNAGMKALFKPTEDLKLLFNALGIESVEAKIKQEGLVPVFKQISDAVGGSVEALANLTGRQEAAKAIVTLAGPAYQKFADTMVLMKNDTTAAADAFGIMSQSFDFLQKRADASFGAVTQQFGKMITDTPEVRGLVASLGDAFDGLLEHLVKNEDVFKSLIGSIIPAFQGGLDLTIRVVSTLTSLGGLLAAAFVGVGAAVNGLIGVLLDFATDIITKPVGAIETLLAGLQAVAEVAGFDDMAKKIQGARHTLDELNETVKEIPGGFYGAAKEGVKMAGQIEAGTTAITDGMDKFAEVVGGTTFGMAKMAKETDKVTKANAGLSKQATEVQKIFGDPKLIEKLKEQQKAAGLIGKAYTKAFESSLSPAEKMRKELADGLKLIDEQGKIALENKLLTAEQRAEIEKQTAETKRLLQAKTNVKLEAIAQKEQEQQIKNEQAEQKKAAQEAERVQKEHNKQLKEAVDALGGINSAWVKTLEPAEQISIKYDEQKSKLQQQYEQVEASNKLTAEQKELAAERYIQALNGLEADKQSALALEDQKNALIDVNGLLADAGNIAYDGIAELGKVVLNTVGEIIGGLQGAFKGELDELRKARDDEAKARQDALKDAQKSAAESIKDVEKATALATKEEERRLDMLQKIAESDLKLQQAKDAGKDTAMLEMKAKQLKDELKVQDEKIASAKVEISAAIQVADTQKRAADELAKKEAEIAKARKTGLAGDLEEYQDLFFTIADTFPQMITDALDTINEYLPGFVSRLLEIAPKFIALVPQIFQALVDALPMLINAFISLLPAVAEAILNIVTSVIEAIPGLLQNLTELVPVLIEAIVKVAVGFVEALVENLPAMLNALIGMIGTLVREILANLPTIINALVAAIPTIIKSIVVALPELARTLITELVAGLPEVIASLVAGVPQIILGIITAIPEMITAIVKALPDIITGLVTLIPNVITAVVDKIPDIIQGIIQAIPDIIQALIKAVPTILKVLAVELPVQLGKALLDTIKNAFTKAWDAVKDIFSIKFFEGGVVGSVGDAVGAGLKSIGSGARKAASSVVGAITSLFYEGGMVADSFRRFANGGGVLAGPNPGFDSAARDTIPALLSPGEGIIPASKMAIPGVRAIFDAIMQLNKGGVIDGKPLAFAGGGIAPSSFDFGKLAGGGAASGPSLSSSSSSNVTVSPVFNITTTQAVDEQFIKGRATGLILKEIRRLSDDGKPILNKRGLI